MESRVRHFQLAVLLAFSIAATGWIGSDASSSMASDPGFNCRSRFVQAIFIYFVLLRSFKPESR